MASIRKRNWKSGGEVKTAWIADYFDQNGKRHIKTFRTKSEARDWLPRTEVDVQAGEHVADRASVTVALAAELWLEVCRNGSPDGERKPVRASTLREYQRHVAYITDVALGIGNIRLTRLDPATVDAFLRRLRDAGRKAPMVRKVRVSLSSLISHAQGMGNVGRNVLREQRHRGGGHNEGKELVIPAKAELMAMLDADGPQWFCAFIAIAIYGGLRASEIRALDWRRVNFENGVIQVRQMADTRTGQIQPPKSKASRRDIHMSPTMRKRLAELHLAQGRPVGGLAFATGAGRPMNHANIVNRFYKPLQRRLGMERPKLDIDGKPVLGRDGRPRLLYGLHELRHAAASLFIEQNWTAKKVQTVMGHSSIKVTFDTYGKLFKDGGGDQAEMAKLEAALLG